jgi:glycosyltransferase involved in cell wall biosynthesis
MKVWYMSAYDQPRGQSTRTYDLSRQLIARGHDVTMFCNGYCHFTRREHLNPGELWRVEFVDGIRVVWLKTYHYTGNGLGRGINMLTNAWRSLRAAKALDLGRPDVVLGPSVPLLTGWAAMHLARKYDVPFIFEVRDVWPIALVDLGGLSKWGVVYHVMRNIEKTLYRKAAYISSVFPLLSEHVARSGSDPRKIVHIPNGVDTSPFAVDTEYEGGEGRQLVVMYVGGFGLMHDVATIIRAAKRLQEESDDRFRFVVIGDGIRKSACEKEARSYGLRNLEFRPPVPKSSLPIVQREGDILVRAMTESKAHRFGLNSNALNSYLASGRAVLFSGNVPTNPVEESGAGVSVAAEDPEAMVVGLRQLAEAGAEARLQMGRRGRRYAETVLSIEALGERMESMLASAIAEFHAPRGSRRI